ncbi:hypothetical protein ASF48_09085 [Rathayibacter sp. Leaf299]|uniref:extracellular solute-binding protein n=1 Tax=Rathayibacter sp. Leaf299 TaxID=1736328 RepID=UPI0006F2A816|nr:extracellular solute-binding protein [Rathayibacter sp. Leaf299]KQQ20739.1 hypothetical protein ASF48_09085 [Rathayibacter sp. Leaf299]
MRTARRSLAAAAVITATALTLTGCGRSSDPDAGGTASAAVADGPATGTITLWAMGNEGDRLTQILEGFEEANPDSDIEIVSVPWGSAYDKVSAAIAADSLPDLVQVGTTWMGGWAAAGAFDPLPEGLVEPEDFFEGPWGTTEIDGVSYGVPWNTDPRAFIYRKDFADSLGLEAPTTWDELTAFTTALQESGQARYGIYLPPSGTDFWQNVAPFALQADAEFLTEDEESFDFDSEGWREGLAYYQSFFTDGVAETRQLVAGQENVTAFVDGDIGSFIDAPYVLRAAIDQGGPSFADKVGIAELPAKDASSESTSLVGGSDWAVSANSDNRDGAWKLAQYFGTPEVQTQWYAVDGSTPANEAAWTDEITADPITAVYGAGLENARSAPTVATWPQVAASLDTNFERVAKGSATPEEALEAIQNEADAIGLGR